MVATKDTLITQALSLNEADRLEMIERLADSLAESADADVAAAWDAEIDRRLEDIAAGRATFTSWEEARRRIVGQADAANA